jgi:hypothetical protein
MEFIAPPKFSHRMRCKNGDVHNFHYTPYLPTKKCVYILNYYLVGRKAMEIGMNLDSLFKSIDKEKLAKLAENPEIQEKLKNVDINKLLAEIKNNPEVLQQLKKLF